MRFFLQNYYYITNGIFVLLYFYSFFCKIFICQSKNVNHAKSILQAIACSEDTTDELGDWKARMMCCVTDRTNKR